MQDFDSSPFHVVRSRETGASQVSEDGGTNVFVIEESLGYLVNYLARLFSQVHGACLAPHGVYIGQWAILMFLWNQDGQSQKDLSRQAAIDDATMVRSLDRMERDGLVQRVRSQQDRRQIHIFLTEKGHALRDILIPCALSVNGVATQNFSEVERHQLVTLLRRMIVSLEHSSAIQAKRK